MVKPLLRYFLLFSFLLIALQSFSQGTSNKGTDFWLGYGTHISTGNMVLYLTSDVNTTATVTVAGVGFTQTIAVTANTITTVSIPTSAHLNVEGKSDLGIHVTSLRPIIVYAHIYANSVSGATLVLPVNTLGKDYYSINYKQISNSAGSVSYFFVVAVEDNTQVEITPSQNTQGGWLANTTHVISLNKGEIYHVMGTYYNVKIGNSTNSAGVDLTGSRIRSISSNGTCKKIAVFSGSSKISVNCLSYDLPATGATKSPGSADNLFQQVYPTATWGKKFITVPSAQRNFDVYRIVKSDPKAVVTLNGNVIPASSFTNNLYYDFESQNVNNISSDKPIQAVQYEVTQGIGMNCTSVSGDVGDPEMIYLNPLEQTLTKITMYSTGAYKILKHFINVVVKNEGVASFTVDGVNESSLFIVDAGNPAYSYAQIPVSEGTHNLVCDVGFNAIAYGFGNAESYGYAAGANLTAFGVQPEDQLTKQIVQSGCTGGTYTFNLQLPYEPTEIYLDKGDGGGSQLISSKLINKTTIDGDTSYTYLLGENFTYNTPGTNSFKVRVIKPTIDDCGTGDEFDFDFIVNPKPIASFSAADRTCFNQPVNFTYQEDANEPNISNYLWDFNGEGSSTNKNPTFNFPTSGLKKVKFSTQSTSGCWSDVTEKDIQIVDLPIVKFSNQKPSCETGMVQFKDESTVLGDTISKWHWDFGIDTLTNDTSDLQNPTFIYPKAGTYKVSLTAFTNLGCSNTITKNVIINSLPVPNFSTPDICLNDAAAQFTNSSSIADGSHLNYLWDFGDPSSGTNNTSTQLNPTHVYHAAAVYQVKLTVTSDSGCVSEITKSFTVNGSIPKSNFTVQNENQLCSDQPVVFEDHASVDFGEITKIVWYFDDSDTSVTETDIHPALRADPVRTYTHGYPLFHSPIQKVINVKMEAYSGTSCVSSITKSITLKAVPDVVFDSIPPVCQEVNPFTINQANEHSGLPGKGQFKGDGITSNGLFSPAIAGIGSHKITYSFLADNGCSAVVSRYIQVYPTPEVNAGTDQTILIGGTAQLNGTAVGDSLVYKWVPSVGLDHDDILNPVASPTADTKYTLIAKSKDGCTQMDEVFIKVLQFPVISNTFTPNGDGINDTWNIKYLDSYSSVTVKVFDRYGKEVFKADNYAKPWDGKFNGADLPVGIYYYIITANGVSLKYTGSVSIIR